MADADERDTEMHLPAAASSSSISGRRSPSVNLADSLPDGFQLRPAAVLSASPSQLMSTKATAFSIDSLIKSRDLLPEDVHNRENDIDTFTGSCSPTDVEFVDDVYGDNEPCSVDEEDIGMKHRTSPGRQLMLQPQGWMIKLYKNQIISDLTIL